MTQEDGASPAPAGPTAPGSVTETRRGPGLIPAIIAAVVLIAAGGASAVLALAGGERGPLATVEAAYSMTDCEESLEVYGGKLREGLVESMAQPEFECDYDDWTIEMENVEVTERDTTATVRADVEQTYHGDDEEDREAAGKYEAVVELEKQDDTWRIIEEQWCREDSEDPACG